MSIRVRVSVGKLDRAAGRRAARRALAALHDVGRERIVLAARRGAPPVAWIRDDDGRARLVQGALSLSHRDGRAIAAASDSSDGLGVDLERADAVPPEHARYFLTPRESCDKCAPGLTERWVLKEAAWKALQCTADMPFTAIELAFDRDGAMRGVTFRGVPLEARARLLRPWPGYVAAIVRVVAMRSVA